MSEIIIIVALILLNGVFALSEIALVSARKSSLTVDAERGSKGAQVAMKLAGDPDKFLSTVQIGITLIGILTGIFSGNKIAEYFTCWLATIGISSAYAATVAQTVIVVIVTYLTLVFGELLPKRIGMANAELVAKMMAVPMYWLSVIAYPFVKVLSGSTSLFFNMLGMHEKGSKVTEEEIVSIVREGAEDGEVQQVEQDIVQRVFLMGDLKVDAIMTHKSELQWLDTEMDANEVREIISSNLHAVYPVAEGDLDHVKGIVTMKDLFLTLGNEDFSLQDIVRDPTYFYENTDVYRVLDEMKAKQTTSGLVCDEFGACIGIITMKDILEGIVGAEVEDEEEEPWIVARADGDGWIVDGSCPMYDFLNYFDKVEYFSNEDFNTVAGLCFHTLGHVPTSGECFRWEQFSFEVIDMDGARIDKLIVHLS